MAMTKGDCEEIAGAIGDAKQWVEDGMSAEQIRVAIGERLLSACAASYTGGYGFKSDRFRDAAKLNKDA